MLPAAFLVAASLALPPAPWQVERADTLIRHTELDAPGLTDGDRSALVAAAVRLELLRPGEPTYGFSDEEGYEPELDADATLALLRSLQCELSGAPSLWHTARLPKAVECFEAANFNRKLADHWAGLAVWEPDRKSLYLSAAAQAEWHYEFWFAAGWAQSVGVTADRRRCLAQLRDMLGRDRWEVADWPDFAPAHLFRAR